jgi:glycosyltransferase involved in cell wall biosynthesis
MNNHYGIILPSIKIGGGNRVLLNLAELLIRDNKKTKLFYLNRKGVSFKNHIPNCVSQDVFNESILASILASLIISFKIRFNKSLDIVFVSDPILSIFSFIYSNKKIVRFVQSNDFLLFDKNSKASPAFISIYKFFFKLSQNYKYYNVFFNSKYSLFSYNYFLVKSNRFKKNNIINPAVFTLGYKPSDKKANLSNPNICIVTNLHQRKGLKKFLNILRNSKLANVNYYLITQDDISVPFKNVLVVKPQSDSEYVGIFNKCHIIISTSTFEGFGLPLIEGMALGLVPVSIYNKGLEEYYNGSNIIIFKDVQSYDYQVSKITRNFNNYKKHSRLAASSVSSFTADFFYNSIIQKINPHEK